MIIRLAVLALVTMLLGCAQDYGGITEVRYSVDETTGKPEIYYKSGKEAALIEASFVRKGPDDVELRVTAGDVKAFEGQAIQAARITEQTRLISMAVRDMVTQVLCANGVLTACGSAAGPPTPIAPGN